MPVTGLQVGGSLIVYSPSTGLQEEGSHIIIYRPAKVLQVGGSHNYNIQASFGSSYNI